MTAHAPSPGETLQAPEAPLRTCVVCRETRDTSALLRLRERAGAVTIGSPAGGGGRGAWVCMARPCLDTLDARMLSKAFRRPIALCDGAALRESLTGMASQKIFEMVGLARRLGVLIVGQDQLAERPADCLIVAQDASERLMRAFGRGVWVFGTSAELSRAAGLQGAFVLGFAAGSLAKQAAYWLTVWYEGKTRDGAMRADA